MDLYNLFGVAPNGFDATPFVSSWFLPPYLHAIVRLLLSVYCFTTIAFSFKWFADHTVVFHLQDIDQKAVTFPVGDEGIRQSFSYFTYLSYWGLAFYLFFASMHTFVYARRGHTWLEIWPKFFQALHSTYYTTIVCFPILVSTVYWASMWTRAWWPEEFDQWSMISIHAMNSGFACFEILFSNTKPMPLAHLSVLLVIMTLYLGIAYITKVTEGIYIYLWLDPSVGLVKIILHIVGYAGIITLTFFVVRSVILLRCKLTNQPSEPSFELMESRGASRRSSRIFLTYDQYDLEMLEELKARHAQEDVVEIPEPEPAHYRDARSSWSSQVTTIRPSMVYPKRKSSYDIRNYIRPDSTGSIATMPRHTGFWM